MDPAKFPEPDIPAESPPTTKGRPSREILDFIYCSLQGSPRELFQATYLDEQGQIAAVTELSRRAHGRLPMHLREVVEGAIRHNAAAVILAHNCPGDPAPGEDDIEVTRSLVTIGSLLQIEVLDHIIAGKGFYFSFAAAGLIRQYQRELGKGG